MSYHPLPLKANQPYRFEVPGTLLLVDSVGVADGVDIALIRNGSDGVTMPGRKPAFRHIGRFDGVVLTASVDTIVGIFLSFDDVQLGLADNSSVKVPDGVKITNDNANPVPISFPGGVVNMTAANVGINNTDANPVPVKIHATDIDPLHVQQIGPTTINGASVAATNVIAALLAADATRRGFYARNAGPDPVALVQAGGTFANAAIVLQSGETWKEDIAPSAAWYCICDAGQAATVNVLGAA